MNVTIHWPTVVGLAGMIVTLLAYLLLQARRLHGNGIVYQLMNAVGSAAIIVSLIYAFNLPAMILEVAWLAISIYGIAVGRRQRVQ
ncbi:MAG: CBU_0592 family membrane protein [Rhodanobacteraceae bacterium]